jgi:chaperonin cofactor prefoldin
MSQTAKQLYELLESGDIDEQILLDTMESIGASAKLEDYVHVTKSFEAEITMYDAEIKRLTENKRILQNRIEYMKSKMIEFMQAAGQKTANAGTFKLTMRENKSCEIENIDLIPMEYMREIPAKLEPDKKAMLTALKNGEKISGASLKTSYSVTAK